MTVILEDEKNASLSQSEGYVDVGYVGGLDQTRSITGHVVTTTNIIYSWRPALHDTITLLSIEAEHMEAVETSGEAMWLKSLVEDLDFQEAITFF